MLKDSSFENSELKEILTRLNMKYVFAGNYLEYRNFINKQEKNGYMEISKVEHLNKIKEGGTLIVTGNYKKNLIWPEIEKNAAAKGIIIEEH